MEQMAIFERGVTLHTNGLYSGMAVHVLNALVGAMYAVGGLANQMGVPYAKLPVSSDDFVDDAAKEAAARKMPRIDRVKSKELPLASNNIQGIAKSIIEGKPYTLDTIMFYITNPIYSAPNSKEWEEALKKVFVIETSPFPSETSVFFRPRASRPHLPGTLSGHADISVRRLAIDQHPGACGATAL